MSSSQWADALEAGAIFAGRYRVEGLLGRGGMGTVYRAHDLSVDDTVALKLLSLAGRNKGPANRRFQREVRLARKITHRNVARTFDLGRHEEQLYLTMELVRGGSLAELLRQRGRLSLLEALDIAAAAADGLAAAHAQSVIHRDLKPANLLVERDSGRVVITDFGIAREISASDSGSTAAVGTLVYMAPEQLAGGVVDARTDLYALGMVLHKMLGVGAVAASDGATAVQLPMDVAQLIESLLAVDPHERPSSAEQTAHELRRCAARRPAQRDAPKTSPATAEAGAAARLEASGLFARLPLHSARDAVAALTLAVLPLRCRTQSAAEQELAQVLSEELTDLLARLGGVDVVARGATSPVDADTRSLLEVARELSVDWLVQGTLRIAGESVRLVVRLIDGQRGVQQWTERFDGALEQALAFEEQLAQRIAEALRVELTSGGHHQQVSSEAVAFYLHGRRKSGRVGWRSNAQAAAAFREALALAPDYKPALAGVAITATYSWFHAEAAHAAEAERNAERAVQQALERGPQRELLTQQKWIDDMAPGLLPTIGKYALGGVDAAQADETFAARELADRANPRLAALAAQAMAEAHGLHGESQRALAHIARAADGALADLDWLDHCPLLADVRRLDGFDAVRSRIKRRASEIWTPRTLL